MDKYRKYQIFNIFENITIFSNPAEKKVWQAP